MKEFEKKEKTVFLKIKYENTYLMKDNKFLCEGNSISQSCKISDEGSVNSFHENAK